MDFLVQISVFANIDHLFCEIISHHIFIWFALSPPHRVFLFVIIAKLFQKYLIRKF